MGLSSCSTWYRVLSLVCICLVHAGGMGMCSEHFTTGAPAGGYGGYAAPAPAAAYAAHAAPAPASAGCVNRFCFEFVTCRFPHVFGLIGTLC